MTSVSWSVLREPQFTFHIHINHLHIPVPSLGKDERVNQDLSNQDLIPCGHVVVWVVSYLLSEETLVIQSTHDL